jgi:multidrug efflux pump subunit AcrB
VGSTVTPIVVFLPLVSIEGVTGVFFRALAITVGVSLLTSLALAVTWTPNLSQYFIRSKGGEEPVTIDDSAAEGERFQHELLAAEERTMTGFFGRVVRFYERWLKFALERPWWLAAFCAILIVAAFAGYRFLESDLMPEMEEGGFIFDYWTPAGSSLEETNRMIGDVEKMLRDTPEVESTSRRTGLELGLAAVTEANRGDIAVKLKPGHKRDFEEITSDLRKQIEQKEPAIVFEFVQVLSDMIGDLTGEPQPIEIKLFSDNPEELQTWAPKIADAIGKIDGVVEIKNGIEDTISGPAVVFQVDPLSAARAGFTPEEVATDAAAMLEGEPAAVPVIANDRAYTIRVRFREGQRASLDSMSNTMLTSSTGRTATLGSLATITQLPGQNEIRRLNLQRYVAVTARLEGRDLGSGIREVQKTIAGLKLPSSIRIVYGGTYAEQQRSFKDLLMVLMLAVILVFIVLLFEFRAFAAPIAILASALLSTSGVVFALLITRTTFNIASFMGAIMVIGIVAKNGILLLDADQRFRKLGYTAEDAMVQAGRRRLRPIVMTALAAVAGMLPLALALGAGSQMLKPLAIAVIGGILISMVLSLIVTPAVHFYISGKREQHA